jgi:hypothetical protein
MKSEQVNLFKNILEISSDLPIYLYGKSLLFLFLNREPNSIDLFIKSKHVSEEVIFKLKSLSDKINVSFGKELVFDSEIFTINCISCELRNVLEKIGSIEGKHLTLNDLQKRIIRFIDKDGSSKNPKHIMEAILFSGEIDFNLEIDTMKHIFVNKSIVKQLVKRDIFHLIKNIYFKSEKPRKTISLLNTLGISFELFDTILVESAVLNNLGKKDVNEFFALIFNNIDEEQQEKFFIEKVGFHLRDVDKVLQVTKILNSVNSQDPTPLNARKMLKVYGKDRAMSLYRLFKAIGLIELSQLIKSEKNSPIEIGDLCIDKDYISKAFGVNEDVAKKLLDLAIDIVIIQPELNEPIKLLNAINKNPLKRNFLCQEEEKRIL